MGYELYLRAPPGAGADEAALATRLRAAVAAGIARPTPPDRGGPASEPSAAPPPAPDAPPAAPPSVSSFVVPNGEARLVVRLERDGGLLRGADLDVPFGGSEKELRDAFFFATSTGEALGMVVFDPQLGRELTSRGEEEVVLRWRASQAYMLDVAGVREDPRGVADLTPPKPLLSRRDKRILLGIGALLAAWWVVKAVLAVARG